MKFNSLLVYFFYISNCKQNYLRCSLFFLLALIPFSKSRGQSIPSNGGLLIKTPYNFSLTIPKNWKLLSKQELEEQKRISNSPSLIISHLAYLGDIKNFDNIPHLFVIFYPQSKIGEKGFAYSSNLILSNNVRNIVVNKMNKNFPEWSFKMNDNDYYVDTARRMVAFSSSTKYDKKKTEITIFCYFLMENGAAEINFSFDKSELEKYTNVMKQVWNSVKIDPRYALVNN